MFTIIMIGALAFLSIVEIARYRTAADDEIPYPRRRLVSRLGISAVFIVVLLAMALDNHYRMPPVPRLFYLGGIVVLMLFGVFLIARELSATSRAALEHTQALNNAAADNIVQLIEESRKAKDRRKKEDEKPPAK
ncbi:hypothetical protein LLG95_09395 [bacterium]|nr:hypothetical protein [bacterium]